MCKLIEERLPKHAIFGEEYGVKEGEKDAGVRYCAKPTDVTLRVTSHWPTHAQKGGERVQKLIDAVKLYRILGDCFGYLTVASGGAVIMRDIDRPRLLQTSHSPQEASTQPEPLGYRCASASDGRYGGTFSSITGGNPLKELSAVCATSSVHSKVIARLNS